ncbi:MAG: SGNH/GDSL hydrolase family protein [Limnospira sp.]
MLKLVYNIYTISKIKPGMMMKSIYKGLSLATTSIMGAIAIGTFTELPAKAATLNFGEMYVFGDSLSDTGNIFTLTDGAFPPSTIPDVPSPYWNGRTSNGPLWIDYLANELGLNPTLAFAPSFPANGLNFAFNGATTGTENTTDDQEQFQALNLTFPGLSDQIDAFEAYNTFRPTHPDALYVIWAGANDYLGGGQIDPTVPVNNLSDAVTDLYNVGARNFLLLNLPRLGEAPIADFNPFDPENDIDNDALNTLITFHNQGLNLAVAGLNQNLTGANISLFNVASLFDGAIANPGQYGFTNVADSCFSLATGTICNDPNYLFWDFVHPTTKANQLIASGAYAQLKADAESVPEPSATLALAGLGVGLLVKKTKAKK